jgi:hypothetical protein
MRQFQILLPLTDNKGTGLSSALSAFEAQALSIAGGFTDAGQVRGVWEGPDRRYTDQLRDYRVACEPAQFQSILDAAHILFPDQHAIFAADLGDAWVSDSALKAA